MRCPTCGSTELRMSERHGVEVDYCPGCRGLWLDRGELDKIIEQARTMGVPVSAHQRARHAEAPWLRLQTPTQPGRRPLFGATSDFD